MNIRFTGHQFIVAAAAAASLLPTMSASAAIDASGAQMLARQSGCLKCHAVDKKKDGPAYRDVAAKYKGKPDAETKLTHHITSGERVKFEDGHEEDHKVVKSKDPVQIKNLVDWILSLEGGTAPVEGATKPVEGGKKP
jgi:cytochrome c